MNINNKTYMNTILFVDDKVIVQNNECVLQRSMLQLQQAYSNYNTKISIQMTKTMIFMSNYPLRRKIVLDNKKRPIMWQLPHSCYLGCDMMLDHRLSLIHI